MDRSSILKEWTKTLYSKRIVFGWSDCINPSTTLITVKISFILELSKKKKRPLVNYLAMSRSSWGHWLIIYEKNIQKSRRSDLNRETIFTIFHKRIIILVWFTFCYYDFWPLPTELDSLWLKLSIYAVTY